MQALSRTAKGIFTQYNPLHEIKEGAVAEARNCAMDKVGTFSPRRGFNRYGDSFSPSALWQFDEKLMGLESTTIKYDSDSLGTWVSWSGTWSPPSSTHRMEALQMRTELYLLTSLGSYATEDVEDVARRAGIPTSLDLAGSLYGTGNGWFTPGQVGYRTVWGRLTKYGTLQLGAPSMREAVTNAWTACVLEASGTTVTVTHTGHPYASNDYITTQDLSDPLFTPSTGQITKTGADTYTYETALAPPSDGTGDFARIEDVELQFTIPDEIASGDFYEVYRTDISASDTSDPADEMFRVTRGIVPDVAITPEDVTLTYSTGVVTVALTAHGFSVGDIVEMSSLSHVGYEAGLHTIASSSANSFTYATAGTPTSPGTGKVQLRTITIVDGLDSSFLSDPLYTNPSKEGITQANTRPPWAKTFCQWKNRIWFSNTRREHYIDLQLVDTSGLTATTSTIIFTVGTEEEVYTVGSSEVARTKNFLKDTTSATDAVKIRNTMKSLVRVINQASDYFYAWYTSGIEEAPGIVTIERRTLDSTEFTVTANSAATGGCFEPEIPTTGTYLSSDEFSLLNGVYWSKEDMPYAVPDENFEESLGDPSKEVLRLIPTRDSVLVIKEDGVFRISGDTDRTWTFRPLDLTIFARCPDTWVSLDNSVWGLSTKGVVRVTESGTDLISEPIADQINEILTHTTVSTLAHAVALESDGLYVLWLPETLDDTVASMAYAFPSDGQTGPTTWHRSAKASHVHFDEQRLYYSSSDSDTHVFRERRDFADTDYMDEELDCTVDEVSTYTHEDLGTRSSVRVTFPVSGADTTDMVPKAGDLFRNVPTSLPYAKILSVKNVSASIYELELDSYFPGLAAGNGTLTRSIDCRVTWHPEANGSATVLKRFNWLQLYFREAHITRLNVGFHSDLSEEDEYEEVYLDIQGHDIRMPVPIDHSLGGTLQVKIEHNVANEPWVLLERSIELEPTSIATSMEPR